MQNVYQQLVGQTIQQYQMVSVLGQDSMGAVLKGFDPALQREVAVRVMDPHLAEQPGFQERFLREARTAARLDHPNIVQVHTFGRHNTMLYIIMKFVPGKNLEQILEGLRAQQKWLVLHEALEITRQLGLALEYAHRMGILHLDLKPANVMIELSPSETLPFRPVITGLGLARLAEGDWPVPLGGSTGSPAYISPEQALGKETGPCSDVYSLGVILFELCTGQLPFQVRSLPEAIEVHIHTPPLHPRSIRPDLPAAVEAIILKAMEKDPANRFAHGGEMAQAIGAVRLAAYGDLNPAAVEDATSLMTQYQVESQAEHDPSVLEEFRPPPLITGDLIQVLTPDHQTANVPLGPHGATIGREPDNTVVLSDVQASRHHARIDIAGGEVRVVDLNSTNGTYMDNIRLLPGLSERWTEGKALRIGSTWLRLWRGSAAAGAEIAASATPVTVTGAAGEAPSSQVDLAQTGAKPAGQAQVVAVTIATSQLTVQPGDSASLEVSLQNLSPLVDHYLVTIKGVPAAWLVEPVLTVETMPGEQQEITLTIHPPRSPLSQAGQHDLVVQVTSQQAAGLPVEAPFTLVIGAYSEFHSEMRPARVLGGRPARILVHNLGNAQADFIVQWSDHGEALIFKPQRASLRVEGGQEGEVLFSAQPRQRSLLGRKKTYSFTALVSAESGLAQNLSGELASQARLSGWPLVIAILLCLGLLAALLLAAITII